MSVYASQCATDERPKDNLYNSLVNVVRKLGETKIVVIAGDFNVGSDSEDFWCLLWLFLEIMVIELRIGKWKEFWNFDHA